MVQEPQSKTWIVIIVAIISATAVICAAIIGLGAPFAERFADEYYPKTTSPSDSGSPDSGNQNPSDNQQSEGSGQEAPATNPPSSSSQIDCSKMIEGEHHPPTLGLEWKFEAINENRIIHIWSNHWDTNLPEYKFFLPAGQSVSFTSGGGSFWTEKEGCNGVAQVIYERDTMQEISLNEYQGYISSKTIP